MALLSEVQERSWASDKYGDRVKRWKWDWRDERIVKWIQNFKPIGEANSRENIERLGAVSSGEMKRSVFWKTWSASGGDEQVFNARYLYYSRFVELAVGRGDPYAGQPVPNIPGPQWGPIKVPTRRRRGKPFVVTEMRTQATKFAALARKEFSFAGTMFLVFAMGDNQSAHEAVNRALFWRNHKDKWEHLTE